MISVAILGTEKNFGQRDLKIMSDHLEKALGEIEGVGVERLILSPTTLPDFSPHSVLVFCGYDHLTLSSVHLALDSDRDIILYDEPGRAIEREFNSVLFLGMDCGRIPPSSLSRITHSWTYRDIMGIVKTKLIAAANAPQRTDPSSSSEPDRARQVESPRKTPTRKRTETVKTGEEAVQVQ